MTETTAISSVASQSSREVGVYRRPCKKCRNSDELVFIRAVTAGGLRAIVISLCGCDPRRSGVPTEWLGVAPHPSFVDAVRKIAGGEAINLEEHKEPCRSLEGLATAWGDFTLPRGLQSNDGPRAVATGALAQPSNREGQADAERGHDASPPAPGGVPAPAEAPASNGVGVPSKQEIQPTPAQYAEKLDMWGLHVLPLRAGEKRPIGDGWHERSRQENLRLFGEHPGAGLGFIPGRTTDPILDEPVPQVHVDVDGPDAWRWFQARVPKEVWGATVGWRSARGGYGFLFRLPAGSPLAEVTVTKVWHQDHSQSGERNDEAVELRVQRMNGVLPPTVVAINGQSRAYTWLPEAKRFEDFAGPSAIPLLPDALLPTSVPTEAAAGQEPEALRAAAAAPGSDAYLDAVGTVTECVRVLPAEAVTSYGDAVNIGMMIHSALPDNTGFGLWDSLCRKAEERYAQDTSWTREKWRSFHQDGNSTGQLTLASLVSLCQDWQSRSATPGQEAGSRGSSKAIVWDRPIDFAVEAPIIPFPVESLSPQMRRLVESVAASLEVPLDFAAILLLGAVAGAAQRTCVIRVTPDYREPLCLYLIVVAASGERKTPATRVFRLPYDKAQEALRTWMGPVIAKAEAELEQLEREKQSVLASISSTKKELNKLLRPTSDEERTRRDDLVERKNALKEEATELAARIAAQAVPPEPLLWLTEATPEATSKLLSELQSLVVFASEGDLIDVAAGQYSDKTGKLGILLSAYSMDTHTEGRMEGNREAVEPRLTIILAIQPAVVEKLQTVPDFHARGLTPRFLYAEPASRVGTRDWNLSAAIDGDAQAAYWRIIGGLLGVTLSADALDLNDLVEAPSGLGSAEQNGSPLPPQQELRLTPEALARFQAYARELEPQLVASESDLSSFATWGSKLPGQMLRIAGVLHVMVCGEVGDEHPWDTPISVETIERAIAVADYFKAHTLRLFVRRPHTRERIVLEWTVEHRRKEFSARDLFRSVHRQFGEEMNRLNATLAKLEDLGWIRCKVEQSEGRGRPSSRYLVNPHLWEYARNWGHGGTIGSGGEPGASAPPVAADEGYDSAA